MYNHELEIGDMLLQGQINKFKNNLGVERSEFDDYSISGFSIFIYIDSIDYDFTSHIKENKTELYELLKEKFLNDFIQKTS